MLQLENLLIQNQIDLLRNKENTMPVPIIAAAAAAAAARLAAKKLAQGAAKKVLPNTIRVSAADRKRIAARKAAANPKKASRPATKIGNEPVSKNNTRKLIELKSAVKVKPARKQIPNPPDAAKARYKKELTNEKQRAREDDWVKEDINLPRSPKKTPVKINTDPTKPKGSFITEAKKIAMQEARSEGPAKKISAAQKMLNDKATALRAAKNKALANSAKGKTQTPTAEAARRRNLNK